MFSVFVFASITVYFVSYILNLLLYVLKLLFHFNIDSFLYLAKNIIYFTPLILINILCIFLFLLIFIIFTEIKSFKFIEIYYYLRYICHPKTISIILSYIPIKDNFKFFPMLISFILISNIYEFMNAYKILSYKYQYINQQFHISDKHVRYQIISSLMLLRISDIMSNHQILITDASHIIDMFRCNNILFQIIERYDLVSANFLDTKPTNYSKHYVPFSYLSIVESLNILIYIFLIKIIKKRFM